MAASLLNEMGAWNPDAIERQLAHVDTNQVRRAYARGEYWEERMQMMQRWSDYLDELRDGGKNSPAQLPGGATRLLITHVPPLAVADRRWVLWSA